MPRKRKKRGAGEEEEEEKQPKKPRAAIKSKAKGKAKAKSQAKQQEEPDEDDTAAAPSVPLVAPPSSKPSDGSSQEDLWKLKEPTQSVEIESPSKHLLSASTDGFTAISFPTGF